jgi:membrane associated rhomboid family serine protease
MSFPEQFPQSSWQGPPRGRGRVFLPNAPVTRWLIIINVVVFFADLISGHRIAMWGVFSYESAIQNFQVWRFVTFQFLHAGVLHILMNMIVLYFFGPIVEGVLTKTKFLIFYLLCGCAGAGSLLLLSHLSFLKIDPGTGLVGASAGILGVVIAAAQIAPSTPVIMFIIVFPVRMQLRTLAWLYIGIAVAVILGDLANAGGEAAHLGGAALGYILIRSPLMRRKAVVRKQFWRPGDENFLRDEFRG